MNLTDQGNVRSLDHCIGCFDCSDETLGLDHA